MHRAYGVQNLVQVAMHCAPAEGKRSRKLLLRGKRKNPVCNTNTNTNTDTDTDADADADAETTLLHVLILLLALMLV